MLFYFWRNLHRSLSNIPLDVNLEQADNSNCHDSCNCGVVQKIASA